MKWHEFIADVIVKFVLIWLAICLCVWAGKKAFGMTITEPCGLTAEELEEVLPEQLKEYAVDFIRTEEEEGVNAFFLMAIARYESGYGKSKLATKHGNLFGIKHHGRYIWWDDKAGTHVERSIEHCGWFLRKRFIEHGVTRIHDIGMTYCGTEEWGDAVSSEFKRLQEVGSHVEEIRNSLQGKTVSEVR